MEEGWFLSSSSSCAPRRLPPCAPKRCVCVWRFAQRWTRVREIWECPCHAGRSGRAAGTVWDARASSLIVSFLSWSGGRARELTTRSFFHRPHDEYSVCLPRGDRSGNPWQLLLPYLWVFSFCPPLQSVSCSSFLLETMTIPLELGLWVVP